MGSHDQMSIPFPVGSANYYLGKGFKEYDWNYIAIQMCEDESSRAPNK